jgi:hypothetical protein
MNFSSSMIDKNYEEMINNFKNNSNVIEIENIYVYFFYNVNNTCDSYKREIVNLTNGTLLKETLMKEIVKNRNDSGRRFNVSGIYSYNFDTTDLTNFLDNEIEFKEYTNVDNIKFNNSIDFFEHHNSLFVFFTNEKNKNTKKSGENTKSRTLKVH